MYDRPAKLDFHLEINEVLCVWYENDGIDLSLILSHQIFLAQLYPTDEYLLSSVEIIFFQKFPSFWGDVILITISR